MRACPLKSRRLISTPTAHSCAKFEDPKPIGWLGEDLATILSEQFEKAEGKIEHCYRRKLYRMPLGLAKKFEGHMYLAITYSKSAGDIELVENLCDDFHDEEVSMCLREVMKTMDLGVLDLDNRGEKFIVMQKFTFSNGY